MAALHRIGVLVERRAVELAEPMRVLREMAWHPVEDHGKAGAVAGIDQGCEIGGRAERPAAMDSGLRPLAGPGMTAGSWRRGRALAKRALHQHRVEPAIELVADRLERTVMLGGFVQEPCERRDVHRHTRPGSRSVISWSSQTLPSGSLNEAYVA